MRPLRRTSHRNRSSPRCGTSTVSTGTVRSGRGLSEAPGSEDFDTGDLGTFSEGVAAGLASLPPDQRAVIVLRYLLEYSPGEIADMLELPRGTVNSRLRRGLDRLEAIVDREQR
jgi:DNA-directed RNA polymerase specialized sigma24 family protein